MVLSKAAPRDDDLSRWMKPSGRKFRGRPDRAGGDAGPSGSLSFGEVEIVEV